MSDQTTSESAPNPASPQTSLRPLCHLVRWSAVLWIAWALGLLVANWSNKDHITRAFGHHLGQDISDIPTAHYAVAFAIVLLVWAVAAVMVAFIWRLFGQYLRGHIFSADAANELRWLGWAGLATVCVDVAARPLMAILLTLHLGTEQRTATLWAEPNDLLHVFMALFVVVLAQVFSTGAAIAEEHQRIV